MRKLLAGLLLAAGVAHGAPLTITAANVGLDGTIPFDVVSIAVGSGGMRSCGGFDYRTLRFDAGDGHGGPAGIGDVPIPAALPASAGRGEARLLHAGAALDPRGPPGRGGRDGSLHGERDYSAGSLPWRSVVRAREAASGRRSRDPRPP